MIRLLSPRDAQDHDVVGQEKYLAEDEEDEEWQDDSGLGMGKLCLEAAQKDHAACKK